MIASKPIQINEQEYDRYSLNLSINGFYNADGSPDATVAIRLIPTKINENGEIEKVESSAFPILLGSIQNNIDSDSKLAVEQIQKILQEWINNKGL